ncbi:MAG: hypothetical protein ACKO3R_07380 [bacterium]
MKRLFFLLLFLITSLFTNFQPTYSADKLQETQISSHNGVSLHAHNFCGGYKTKALIFAHDAIELEVTEALNLKDYPESFPVGTRFYGKLIEHREPRRISRDEIRKFHLERAILPNGKTEAIDELIKIRATKKTEAAYWVGNALLAGTGQVLGITLDFVSIGLPVARGGTAIWGMADQIYESRAGESKFKEGAKGFVKGALLPIPFFVLKGDPLYIHPSSTIVIHKDKNKEYINAGLIRKYNDIKLEAEYRNKYHIQ